MTAAERGLALLCCPLGREDVKPLSPAQLRQLRSAVLAAGLGAEGAERSLAAADLEKLGYAPQAAARILRLLDREAELDGYLQTGARMGITPVTRLSAAYPRSLLAKRGSDAPAVLFCAGNLALWNTDCVAVVGSRKLLPPGAAFAGVAGMLAARETLTLVTGGAEGADSKAMETCGFYGGSAIVFVPDELSKRKNLAGEQCLVCSELGYDLPFSPLRAFSRNRCIHMLPELTLVAQTACAAGGTWSGSVENLRRGWSRLYVHDDGSQGAAELIRHGAAPLAQLTTLRGLEAQQQTLF